MLDLIKFCRRRVASVGKFLQGLIIPVAKSFAAFSLIEVIVAIAIFAIFSVALLTSVVGVGFSVSNSEDRFAASYLVQEAQEALHSIRDYDWLNLSEGTYGLTTVNGYWEFAASPEVIGEFERSLVITAVNSYTYDAVITVSWTSDQGIALSTNSTARITNWESLVWIVDSYDDFDNGYENSVSYSVNSGAVQLDIVGDFVTGSIFTEDLNGTGNPNEIIIEDNILYIVLNSTTGEEFLVYDISDISNGNITEIGSTEIGSDVNDIAIYDGYAFLATDSNIMELVVVDLSTYAIVTSLDLEGRRNANGISIEDGQAVVVRIEDSSYAELYIVDVSNVAAIAASTPIAVEFGYNLYDVEVYDGYAFIVSEDGTEFSVLRLSDQTIVNSYNFVGGADMYTIHLSADGQIAYLGRIQSGDEEFYQVDISSPASAFSAGDITAIEIGETIYDIYVYDGIAYLALADSSKEVGVLNLSTHVLSTINLSDGGTGRTVWYQGAHIFAGSTDGDKTLQVVTSGTGGWSAPNIIDSDDLGGSQNMYDIVIDGSYAYMGRDSTGTCNVGTGAGCEFLIYDISTPTAISLVGALEIGADVNDVYVNGTYVYLANDGTELQVVDVSVPSAPSIVGSYNSDSRSNGESVSGSGAYVYLGTAANRGTCNNGTGKDCEFYVLDVSTPSNPVYFAGAEIGQHVYDIAVNGVYAYLATPGNSEEINIIDLSTPSSPATPVTYDHSGSGNANGLYYDTSDDTLHIALSANGTGNDYSILDFSFNPTVPSAAYGLSYNSNTRMVALIPGEDVAFLAGDDNNDEFKLIDISDITNPFEISSLSLGGDANGIATDGIYAYTATEYDSQEIQVIGASLASTEYAQFGIYTSEKHDSGSASTNWDEIEWTESGIGTLQFQTRTASSEAGLASAVWLGSDGTNNTYYTVSGDSIQTASGASGSRWIQFAAYFYGNSASTPVCENVSISY